MSSNDEERRRQRRATDDRRGRLSRTKNFHTSITNSLRMSGNEDEEDNDQAEALIDSSTRSTTSAASAKHSQALDVGDISDDEEAKDTFCVHSGKEEDLKTQPPIHRPVLLRQTSPSLHDLFESKAPPARRKSRLSSNNFYFSSMGSMASSSRSTKSRVSLANEDRQREKGAEDSDTDEEELAEALDQMQASINDFAPSGISLDRKSMRGSVRYISPSNPVPAIDEESAILLEVAQAFELGIEVKTTMILTQKIETFIGSDAVDWLLTAEFASSRNEAEAIGKRLMDDLHLFEHVPAGVPFFDDLRYYRFIPVPDRTYPAGYEQRGSKIKSDKSTSAGSLDDIAKLFRNGVRSKDHKHRNMTFRKCFIGADAVNWIIFSSLAASKREAVQLGQRLSKELGLFKHIRPLHEDEQDFRDDHLFFRFAEDEKDLTDRERMPEPSFDDNADLPMMNFGLGLKVASAVSKFKKASKKNLAKKGMSEEEREALLKYLGFRLRHWGASFHQTDPRRQILDFISGVKQIRDERVVAHENRKNLIVNLSKRGFPVNPRLQQDARASLFAIFRPTSADAIRKMMTGEAVGKGLDIKGKSAKRGKLSAFVPYLQISENHHKTKIKTLSTSDTLRIFFSSVVARDSVGSVLEQVCEDMMLSVAKAKSTIQNIPDESTSGCGEFDWEDVQNALAYEMDNPEIRNIDEYAPQCYGLEVPVRLFWEAYIVQQDISRTKGSQYDGGRPSIPAFQDKNTASLCSPPKDGNPRAVLWQYADLDTDTAMNPFELLMAYEEHNRVFPVVSDFDAFLVGSQRVSFHQPLPPDQIEVLKWSVNRIQDILANPGPESWTSRWLEVIENPWEGEEIHPVMPRFGFGDPASYSIMERAANTLASGDIRNGAVRHGAECFNYYFPQDLDDEFLIISDSLPEHWKYADPQGVQEFLLQKIKEGYTFPLNPKWILCDGWGALYDELFKSDRAEARESLNTWFPPDSGLREQIAEIRKNYPEGFVRKLRRKTLKGVDPSVLADIISLQTTTNLDGESTAASVSTLLSNLESNDEQEVSRTTSSLASMSTGSNVATIVVKELGRSMPLFLRCLDEFIMSATIQMNILSIFEALVDTDIEALTDIGLGPALLNHLARLMMVHGTHEDLVVIPCRILIGILPHVSDNILKNVSTDLFEAILPMLDKNLDNLDIQTVGLNMLLVLCKQQKPYQVEFVNCNGCELIVKSMKHQIDSHDVQAYGCSIFYMLSQRSGGGQVIGERGAIEAVVNAMARHPESIILQNDALMTVQSMARVSKNRAAILEAGAEDAILYSVWINVSDSQVVANAFDALRNFVADRRSGVASNMRDLTLSILIVAMKRHQVDGNLQRSALDLLQTYASLPKNVLAMKRVYEQDLWLLFFSAAENYPGTCSSVAQNLMARMDKI